MNASDASSSGTDATPNHWLALGSKLQQARESRNISLSDLAAKLRMGQEQLQALEAGERSRLPETVFVIAQARRVADALGVDIQPLLEPLRQERSSFRPAAPARSNAAQAKTSGSAVRWLGGIALLAGLVAAGSWAWQHGFRLPFRAVPTLAARQPSPAPAPAAKKPTAPATATATATELTLRSQQPSWLAVRSSDGKTLYEGTLLGTRVFPLQGGLEVLAGRPDLVQVSLGGRPARALGKIDQIRWVRFSAPRR